MWLLLFASAGCGKNDGLSDYERKKKGQEDAAQALRELGAKFTQVHNPQGESWAVNLRGMTITDDLLKRLKLVGYITHLDLGKSTISDAHMARVNEVEIGSLLLKLDLSHTAVSDAGLAKLDNLILLMHLNLQGTKVTAAGVERFLAHRANDKKFMIKNPTVLR